MNLQKLALKLKGYNVDDAMVGLKKDLAISHDEFHAWLEARKWAQVKHFHANNPFYREMVGATLPDRWEDLPILTKKDYQRPIEELLSTGFNKKKYLSSQYLRLFWPSFLFRKRQAYSCKGLGIRASSILHRTRNPRRWNRSKILRHSQKSDFLLHRKA